MARYTLFALALGLAGALFPATPGAAQETPVHEESTIIVCDPDEERFHERNDQISYGKRLENRQRFAVCQEQGNFDLKTAIESAPDGSEVLIMPGRYSLTEPISLQGRTELSIRGGGDRADETVLRGAFAIPHLLAVDDSSAVDVSSLTLQETTEAALAIRRSSDITATNVQVETNSHYGMLVSDSEDVRLEKCRSAYSSHTGIQWERSSGTIEKCQVEYNLYGISIHDSEEVNLYANDITRNMVGLYAGETTIFRFEKNTVSRNNLNPLSGVDCSQPLLPSATHHDIHVCGNLGSRSGVGMWIHSSAEGWIAENYLWGNRGTALLVTSDPMGQLYTEQISVKANHFGERNTGRKDHNHADIWWDGMGSSLCFDTEKDQVIRPAALPSCDGNQRLIQRYLGDPFSSAKVWYCTPADLANLQPYCDWNGAATTQRVEFRLTLIVGMSVLVLTGIGWLAAARTANPPSLSALSMSTLTLLASVVLMVSAAWSNRSDYEAMALALLALAWFLAARLWRKSELRTLAAFTVLIAVLVAIDAFDRGLWTFYYIPISLGWTWIALLPLWALVVIASLFKRRPREMETAEEMEPPHRQAPEYNRFQWQQFSA